MANSDFIIIGDTEKYEGCLVCVAGDTQEKAEKELERMKNNPTEKDKRLIEGHTNLRIKEVPAENCWWRNV